MVVSSTAGMNQEAAVRRALHSGGDMYSWYEPAESSETAHGSGKGITRWANSCKGPTRSSEKAIRMW